MVFIDAWFYSRLTAVIVETVDTLEARQKRKGPKATTVLRITMRTTLIPVTVGIFKIQREHEGPKVTTVTRMEAFQAPKTTPKEPIPEACLGGGVGGDTTGGGAGNAERRTTNSGLPPFMETPEP